MNWFKNFFGKVFSKNAPEEVVVYDTLQSSAENALTTEFEDANKPIDEKFLLELEEKLLRLDCGLEFAEYICQEIRKQKNLSVAQARVLVRDLCLQSLEQANSQPSGQTNAKLQIVLVVGVNGAGKTTSIGKLAYRWVKQGKKVLVAPCDTFRAAAKEQLQRWVERAGAQILIPEQPKKPDALLFAALKKAQTEHFDILLVDTAGRLQSKKTLMEELSKLSQVISKHSPESTSKQSLLVLDATTGQNGYQQAVAFNQVTQLNGLILTKFDGSAKGGIVFAISHNLKLPIRYLGLGEKIDQLTEFKIDDFVREVLSK